MSDTVAGEYARKPSLLSRLVRRIIMLIYRWQGWSIQGHLPIIPKYVIAGAPHSTGWDFVFFIGATADQGVQPNVMAKHTLFRWPIKNFLLDMGAISIDKTKPSNTVEQMAEEYKRRGKLALVIAAEGTRTSNGEWKSGFYHIAEAAGVPIVAAWACNVRRIIGFSDPIVPSGDYARDLGKIAAFMRANRPNYPRFKVLEEQANRLKAERRN